MANIIRAFLAGLHFMPIVLLVGFTSAQTKPPDLHSSTCVSDAAYNADEVLKVFRERYDLTAVNEGYGVGGQGFYFIWDLTDPSNKLTSHGACISFKEGHFYHFSRAYYAASFSHIARLRGGKIEVFDSVNCPSGQTAYLKLLDTVETDKSIPRKVLKRLKNYRDFGTYFRTDFENVACKQDTRNRRSGTRFSLF